MTKLHLYIALAIAGLVLPYSQFAPWLLQHGLAPGLLWYAATANPIASFAWADVLVSGLALLAFCYFDSGNRNLPKRWLVPLSLFSVGVSLALPVLLILRETQARRVNTPNASLE